MIKMGNNIKLLLSLFGASALIGGYVLIFAPVVYQGTIVTNVYEDFAYRVLGRDTIVITTVEEDNAYREALGMEPIEIGGLMTQERREMLMHRQARVAFQIPRGEDFPYGARWNGHIYIGVLNLVAALITLVALGWEVKHQLGKG